MSANVSLYVGECITGHARDGADFLQVQAMVNLRLRPDSHTCQLITACIPVTPKVYLYNWPDAAPLEVVIRDRHANLLSVMDLAELSRALRADLATQATRALALAIAVVDTYRSTPASDEIQVAVAYQW